MSLLHDTFRRLDLSRLPTPCYVVDEALLERNLQLLAHVQAESGAKVLLALKGFAMFHFAPLISRYLSGVCASGLHEAKLGREFFSGEVHTFSAAYPPADMDEVLALSDHVVFNSCNQWERFRAQALAAPARRERKLVRYVLLVVLASQFHVSVLLLLVVYLIPYMRLSTFGDWFKWGALIGIVMFSLNWLLTWLLISSAYYGHYLHSDYADGGVRSATVLLIITRIILLLLAATCGWNASVEADSSGRTRNLLALAVTDVALVGIALGFNLLDRIEMYLTLPFAVGLANLAAHGERPERSYVSALLVVIAFAATTIFFLYRPEWYHLFPYRTFLEEGLP